MHLYRVLRTITLIPTDGVRQGQLQTDLKHEEGNLFFTAILSALIGCVEYFLFKCLHFPLKESHDFN